MKEKESVSVIIRDLSENPHCPHGPTILFSYKNGMKFFGCSCWRNACFFLELDVFEKHKKAILNQNDLKVKQISTDNEIQLKKESHFCFNCQKIFLPLKAGPHENHTTKLIDKDFLAQPSLFLTQLDNDKFNAQYFFDDPTLKFIVSMFEDLQLSQIICIGTPRLHEFIRAHKNGEIKSLLMDIDNRFQPFYPNEFCHFNMFNYHFMDGADGEAKLVDFLKSNHDDERSHHCIFVDPPFAARTELLTVTLKRISALYFSSNHKHMPIFWVFPYFNEAHICKEMPEMEMLDYQVTYRDHYAFNQEYKGRKEGSPVRIFTNIDQSLIKYPSFLNNLYRFCQQCLRHVALKNNHCFVCKVCPSKNGSEYRHCDECIKCVKPNYFHCYPCGRCVQKSNHNCIIYQSHQECWGCNEKGHVENYCSRLKQFKVKKGKCRICNEKHNLKICKNKFKYF